MLKQVFRVEGRRKLDAGLVRHVRGEARPAEALGRPEWDGRSRGRNLQRRQGS